MSAKEDYLDLMSERRACGRSRLDFVIEAYVTELEQRCEGLEKEIDKGEVDRKIAFDSCCDFARKNKKLRAENERLKKERDSYYGSFVTSEKQAIYYLEELYKLRARIEGSPKVFTSWDGGIIVDAAPRAELLHEGEETREVYAVPVLEEEKEEHEKLG